MELPLPSGVTSITKPARQVFWLSDQPENVSLPTAGLYQPRQWPACALTSSVPDYSGGTAPDFNRVPDCLGVRFSECMINMLVHVCQAGSLSGQCSAGRAPPTPQITLTVTPPKGYF